VILRRHVESYFDVTEEERAGMWDEVARVKSELDAEVHPDGYTVGVNVGVAGGQTVMHVHIHVIPRYTGDVPDPRGGIRGVIPGKRTYGDSE